MGKEMLLQCAEAAQKTEFMLPSALEKENPDPGLNLQGHGGGSQEQQRAGLMLSYNYCCVARPAQSAFGAAGQMRLQACKAKALYQEKGRGVSPGLPWVWNLTANFLHNRRVQNKAADIVHFCCCCPSEPN
ncbi:hypothetical protein L7F22_031907 [Adiantum nelumboides]|nr:hypothetical protein [Adiantum nelumboides]